MSVTHDYRLRRKALILPKKIAGAVCFAVWLIFGIIAVTAQRMELNLPLPVTLMISLMVGLRFWFLLAWCILWRMSYGKKTHQGDPLGNCVEQFTFYGDHLVSLREAGGAVQQTKLPYLRLYQLIETKDALFLYQSPTVASVLAKADFQAGELELLKETILPQMDQTPPVLREVYKRA